MSALADALMSLHTGRGLSAPLKMVSVTSGTAYATEAEHTVDT